MSMLRIKWMLCAVTMTLCLGINAQRFDKESYYAAANGKKGAALKSALAQIIYKSTAAVSYDGLLEAYKTTDVRPDGKIWDMYSNVTNYVPGSGYAATYKVEGDGYNREHSIPQSIFGSAAPMKSDLYHVYPTDGKINGVRSNYCFGEVGTVKTASKNNFSVLGSPTGSLKNAGCSEGYVFEPNDMYKGDFARTYFYFVTCYEGRMKSFDSFGMFSKNTYPSLSNWAKEMLIKWSEDDVVSDKETDRIEAVYKLQHNRNPFIDFPGLEQYIWGDYQEIAFSVSNYINPLEEDPSQGGETGGDDDNPTTGGDDDKPTGGDDDDPTGEEQHPGEMAATYTATYYFDSKEWGAQDEDGNKANWVAGDISAFGFINDRGVQITKEASGAYATSPVTFADVERVEVTYTTNASKGAGAIEIMVGGIEMKADATVTSEGGTTPRKLTFTSTQGLLTGKVRIDVICTTNSIYINNIKIYGGQDKTDNPEEDGLGTLMAGRVIGTPIIYDLSGRRVMHTERLTPGIYLIDGRKVIVR